MVSMKLLVLVFVAALASGCMASQQGTETNGIQSELSPSSYGSPHPKVPSSHPACCEHPYWHTIYRATSQDGIAWEIDGVLRPHASVPEALVLENGTIILYYVDGIYDTLDCIVSPNGKDFYYGNCTIYGFTEQRAWDPTVVSLGNGSYRLYFFSPAFQGENRIMSAISQDGINWVQEPGVRFSHQNITDPDVAWIGGYWRMYSFYGTRIMLARSHDGLSFMKEAELNVGEGIVDLVPLGEGRFAMYLNCIDRAESSDGLIWSNRQSVMRDEGGIRPCMPAVARTKDGYIMYFLGFNLTAE